MTAPLSTMPVVLSRPVTVIQHVNTGSAVTFFFGYHGRTCCLGCRAAGTARR